MPVANNGRAAGSGTVGAVPKPTGAVVLLAPIAAGGLATNSKVHGAGQVAFDPRACVIKSMPYVWPAIKVAMNAASLAADTVLTSKLPKKCGVVPSCMTDHVMVPVSASMSDRLVYEKLSVLLPVAGN
jgi:hypothetical protein